MRTSQSCESADEFVVGGVESIDSRDEEASVTGSVCLSLEGFYLAVRHFKSSGGEVVVVVGEDSTPVYSEGFGKIL